VIWKWFPVADSGACSVFKKALGTGKEIAGRLGGEITVIFPLFQVKNWRSFFAH